VTLKTTIQKAAKKALKVADSLAVDATYVRRGDTTLSNYDPATGELTVGESTATIRAFLVAVTAHEIESLGLTPRAKKVIFSRSGFAYDFVEAEDKITFASGDVPDEDVGTWEVVRTLSEPSESIFILAIQRS
jgi:phage baseplate assembly protein gpV